MKGVGMGRVGRLKGRQTNKRREGKSGFGSRVV